MSDHKAPPIKGYQDISDVKLRVVNDLKEAEEMLLRRIDMLENAPFDVDKRWTAIGRTHAQQAFMAIIRGVMQPQRISLPDDKE